MPCEPQFPVMAPGARTWQIVQTCARALARSGTTPRIIVAALEQQLRTGGNHAFDVVVPLDDTPSGPVCNVRYLPLTFDDFLAFGTGKATEVPMSDLPDDVTAVVATASSQPCATGAALAQRLGVPLWVDFFGDPFTEIQTKAASAPDQRSENQTRLHHVWKLHLAAMLQGDFFSALSERQRFALIGQLGAAGRLNRHTAPHDFVAALPFGLFASDIPARHGATRLPGTEFTAMWSGSFNTWMDVDALVGGLAQAVATNPRIRLLVVGGGIPNYHDDAFTRFCAGVKSAGVAHAVEMTGWQPLSELRNLYPRCQVGMNVDRASYEALLGSRTRIVQFLAEGKPVISTVVTELSQELAGAGFVLPFELGNATSLAEALVAAAARQTDLRELGMQGREFVMKRFGAWQLGEKLGAWICAPHFSPDKIKGVAGGDDNPLTTFWRDRAGV